WETGPNAILLSELPVQNGRFCNLIEFPVLQMLYRQGMLVPGHPNNTGRRPLIIGLDEQLASQARYVHIGNYGLSTLAELTAAGLDEGRARELLRMKLKFSFGVIREIGELLDFRTIDGPAVELRGGTFLRRLGLNRYQFLHGEESVEVDLNLGSGEAYVVPYYLPKVRLAREYFSVIHLGEGDGWDRERPCMSSLLMYRGEPWLIDAGPNIEASLEAVGLGVNDLRGVFITHAHDDHFVGLTTLLHAERRIEFCAVPWVRASVTAKLKALAGLGEEEFRGIFAVRDLEEGLWNNVGGLEVRPVLSPHPVETTYFHFRVLGPVGRRTYAHLADLSSFEVLDSMVTDDDSAPGISRAFADRIKAAYLEPVDIKKVDVGGGMIHGAAVDFREDRSGLLFLSHTNMPPARNDKAFGSSAGFGDEEVLIPARIDYSVDLAVSHLRRYFPNLPRSELDVLLNCRHSFHNEGTILVKAGAAFDEVELLLSGVIESLDPGGRLVSVLSSGSLIGSLESLDASFSSTTLRSRSMVETLSVPIEVYREFVARNSLEGDSARYREVSSFLRSCPLFSDMMSLASFADVAGAAVLVRFEDGERVGGDSSESLHLIV
ncbi:MAG: MBL fold metallo-hydrolase, partial [Spirochaetota bacterium]